MNVLIAESVKKTYGTGEHAVKALKDISFTIEQGEFTAIVGTSGSGKSTLLNLLGGLDTPTSGRICIRNHDLAGLDRKSLTIFRRRNIGFVFQNYSLMPVLNVYDNVALPVTFDRGKHIDHVYIRDLLTELGLWEKRKKYPNELSGGQQQRVALARALANKPAIILADEPTGALDSASSAMLLETMEELNRDMGITILMVTHDAFTASHCSRILFLRDGRIFTEMRKGKKDRKAFFQEILDVMSMLGGDVAHVR